jgi:hypothetical protein
MAWGHGRFSKVERSRRKAACQVSVWDSSRRSVFLKAKRSSTRLRRGAESRSCSYRMRVSLGVRTLFVRSARSDVKSITALRRPSKQRRSARA